MDQEILIPSVPNLTGLSRVWPWREALLRSNFWTSLHYFTYSFIGQFHHNLRLDLASSNLYSVDNMVTPTAARMMQATRARMFRPTATQQWG